MEACPKIPMIFFDLKLCNYDSGDFSEKIFSYILTNYQDNPESYQKELGELIQLRENAVNASRDFMGLNILKRYYRQLQFLSNRFPMKSGEYCETEFSWDHIYNQKEIVLNDIRFELLSILYNIGAMHSYLGCLEKRTNDDAIKISCTHFQYAAWAFQIIRDTYSQMDLSSDLCDDIMNFKLNLMLAQAQECVLEKSIIDNRKASINAKVATQIVDYLKLAISFCERTDLLNNAGSKKAKEWKQYCTFKLNYYLALVNLYGALSSVEQKKIGESVGYVIYAEEKINECVKMKYLKEFQDTLKFAADFIDTKSKALKKENDFVYNEKVVSSANLPEIKGVSLVKCLAIDFESDPEIATQDIFSRLVSIKAHEISSLYSEQKDKIIRQINTQVGEKNTQLDQFLAALQINQLSLDSFDYLKLPKQLLECCASVSVRPGLIKQDIPSLMKQIVEVSVDTKDILDDIEEILEKEHKESKEYKQTIGESSSDSSMSSSSDSESESLKNRPKKKSVNIKSIKSKERELLNRYDTLKKNFDDANTSNVALREAFNSCIKNIEILMLPLNELTEKLPKIHEINDEESKAIRDKLKYLLSKVDEMKSQREQLVKRLFLSLQDDDITRLIASKQNEINNLNEFFQEQLKKHEQLLTCIQQNLQAQDNILRALGETNASFAMDRKNIIDATQQRNAFIDNLVFSYQSINDLMEKAKQGVGFFEKLSESLKKLLDDCKEFHEKSSQERSNKKRITNLVNNSLAQYNQSSFPKPVHHYSANNTNNGTNQGNNLSFDPTVPKFNRMQNMSLNENTNKINNQLSSMDLGVSDRPKLKDFLPYMKPQSWGGANNSKMRPPTVNNFPQPHQVPQMQQNQMGQFMTNQSQFNLPSSPGPATHPNPPQNQQQTNYYPPSEQNNTNSGFAQGYSNNMSQSSSSVQFPTPSSAQNLSQQYNQPTNSNPNYYNNNSNQQFNISSSSPSLPHSNSQSFAMGTSAQPSYMYNNNTPSQMSNPIQNSSQMSNFSGSNSSFPSQIKFTPPISSTSSQPPTAQLSSSSAYPTGPTFVPPISAPNTEQSKFMSMNNTSLNQSAFTNYSVSSNQQFNTQSLPPTKVQFQSNQLPTYQPPVASANIPFNPYMPSNNPPMNSLNNSNGSFSLNNNKDPFSINHEEKNYNQLNKPIQPVVASAMKPEDLNAASILNSLNPESVYKPGYFNQIKMPPTNSVGPTFNKT